MSNDDNWERRRVKIFLYVFIIGLLFVILCGLIYSYKVCIEQPTTTSNSWLQKSKGHEELPPTDDPLIQQSKRHEIEFRSYWEYINQQIILLREENSRRRMVQLWINNSTNSTQTRNEMALSGE